jgi:hypothetical protein
MGGAVPKRWRSFCCMLYAIPVSACLCRRAAYLCSIHMARLCRRAVSLWHAYGNRISGACETDDDIHKRNRSMPVHLYRSTAHGGPSGLPWPPEGGEAAHTHTAPDRPNTCGYCHCSRVAVRSSTPGVAAHSGMHGVESACYMLSHSRPPISRRRVAGPRAASASAAVSTHSRGPPYPRAARTLSLTHLLAYYTIYPLAVFPVDSGRAIRARGGVLGY